MLDKLTWRYAVKKMDPAQTVPEEKIDQILEAIRLAPTSSGLQPFSVIVLRNPGLRERIREVAYDQAQITDASVVLVFAAWDGYSAERIDALVDFMAAERGMDRELVSPYYERLKGMYLPRPDQVNFEHAARQAYIAFGFAMAAAAELEVDCVPMEGFDAAAVDDILGLREMGLRSVTLLPLGVRAAEGDWLQPLKKVRRAAADMFIEVK